MSSKKKWLIFKVLLIEYQFGEREYEIFQEYFYYIIL